MTLTDLIFASGDVTKYIYPNVFSRSIELDHVCIGR